MQDQDGIRTDAGTGASTATYKAATGMEVFRAWVESGLDACGDIADEMEVSKGQVSKLATKAVSEGWLRIEGRKYVLVEEGEE
jgi:hypothetical protein